MKTSLNGEAMLSYKVLKVTMLSGVAFDGRCEGNNAAWICPCENNPLTTSNSIGHRDDDTLVPRLPER